MRLLLSSCLVAVLSLAGCSGPSLSSSTLPLEPSDASVWAVDLVHTLPGAQTDYVRSIETNWASARQLARQRGAILSYRALVAPPDTDRGWDVILMTEYADSTAWASREDTFQSIFASSEFVVVEPARPSAEMRTFAASGVVMQAFVSEP